MPNSSNENRQVNGLLHTLRGEQFRHEQNIRNSRSHLTTSFNRSTPTLPAGLAGPDYYLSSDRPQIPGSQASSVTLRSTVAGPVPPKSWTQPDNTRQDHRTTSSWRAEALSLLFSQLHAKSATLVPPLSILCLQDLVSTHTSAELSDEIIPHVPPHLRRDLIRHSAVHSPLPSVKLYPLFEPDGHVDGEILIVGPGVSLKAKHFSKSSPHVSQMDMDWENDHLAPKPLQTLILLSTHVHLKVLRTFPATITHLGLINLLSPVALHGLPAICPLLVFLDLSYNLWLSGTWVDSEDTLDRVDWKKWRYLNVLGFRECYIRDGMLEKLNKGRWDNVLVVQ